MEASELALEPVFRHFFHICQIPHGSGNEAVLGEEILAWAGKNGIAASRDAAGNVLLRRPASHGCAGAPCVMLQAHMDMVCEKREGSGHDFARDPIRWVVDGDLLSTGGETTLGADDGIGMALALELLTEERHAFPELEVLFTVKEEDDLSGAALFDGSLMRAKRLINLDHVNEHEILCGSCGGMQANFTLPVARAAVPEGWSCFRLHISGLRGGHSGEDIHRGHGNANLLLARCLYEISRHGALRICSMEGGSSRLSLPRYAEAALCVPAADEEAAAAALGAFGTALRREFGETGAEIRVTFEKAPPQKSCVRPEAVLAALLLIPDGIHAMNETLEGLVDASDNLGEVRLRENALELVLEIRAARESQREDIYRRMELLAGLLGGNCAASNAYPSWKFRPQSELASLCRAAHREFYGTEPKRLTVHAGLEVGYFNEKRPGLDVISIGPDIRDLHSTGERLSISSVRRFYGYLCHILAALAK